MTLLKDNSVSMKLIVIGDSYAGKTCLIRSYESGTFINSHLSTIGIDYFKKKISLNNNKQVILNLWDTAGQERFQSLTMNYLKGADGLLLCVALTENNYVEQIKFWIDKIQDVIDESEIQILIVGTKSDLVSDIEIKQFQKIVETEFNNKYQSEITSAKTLIGVETAFIKIATMIIKSKEELENYEIQSSGIFKANNTLDHNDKSCC